MNYPVLVDIYGNKPHKNKCPGEYNRPIYKKETDRETLTVCLTKAENVLAYKMTYDFIKTRSDLVFDLLQ